MPTLADLVAALVSTPTATVYLDGQRWYGARKLSYHQKFKEQIESATIEGKNPPVVPRVGMEARFSWGYSGVEVAGFRGYVSDTAIASYPYTEKLQCSGVLWLADQNNEVLQTDPLNAIKASDAARYLLTHYGNIPASRINLPALPAAGAAWVGSEWTLGILTPVAWGDPETQSGGTSAMRAAAEIYGCLGYWLRANTSGTVIASQMERKPSTSAREVFQRNVNLLIQGAPERRQSYSDVYNRVTVRGANTGVDGAQLYDQWETTSPIIRAGVFKDFPFASFLLEYENASDAGAASITEVAKRILNVVSRIPDVVPLRAKADPRRSVGDTVGLIDTGVRLSTQKNYFIYELTRTLDLDAGRFDDSLLLDGGTGNSGFTTVPPPDAAFTWDLMAETLDGDAVVEVRLDGSASTSPSGEIVSYAWSTTTPTYGSTPDTATGETAVLIFLASNSPADITLTVTDTTSKTASFEAAVDLSGADTRPPLTEVVSLAAGSAWYVTPDGGATWNTETANGDAISVGIIGAGADDRAAGTAGTYGLLATRGSGGAGGLRQTLDVLASASTNLVSNSGAVTSNIWVNEANPARVWFAIGTAVYRSLDGGATKTAMHVAPASVSWIMEDPAVDNSIFLLAGANLYNATDPTVGYALLYAGPLGANARQFVRSRDGQVTWICYTGAPAGEALQRVENGAAADFDATDVRSLALDRQASSLRATVYAVTGDDPAQLWAFDGLTGLDAAQSAQTFPAGATVQHILMSRLFDVLYCADFDSIASGQGAGRKYFPASDQLLLWKQLASGEQGHMLGLGARATAPAEFVRLTTGTGTPGAWHYRDGAWAFRPMGISAAEVGYNVYADTFNPDRWLAIWNHASDRCYTSGGKLIGDSWAYSPLWLTEDAGLTWTEIVIAPPSGWVDGMGLLEAAFSDQTGNTWAAAFWSHDTTHSILVTGTGTTITGSAEMTDSVAPGIAAGVENEWLLVVTSVSGGAIEGTRYYDTAFHTPSGSAPADLSHTGIERAPGPDRRVYLSEDGIYSASDYRASQPTVLFAGVSAIDVAVSHTALYFQTGTGAVRRIFDPLGTPVTTNFTAVTISGIHVDRQTRTIGAYAAEFNTIVADDGVTTRMIAGPATDGDTLSAFEVMVRS